MHFYKIDSFEVIQQQYGIVQDKLGVYFGYKTETAIPEEMLQIEEDLIAVTTENPLQAVEETVEIPQPAVVQQPTHPIVGKSIYYVYQGIAFSTVICGIVVYQMRRLVCF